MIPMNVKIGENYSVPGGVKYSYNTWSSNSPKKYSGSKHCIKHGKKDMYRIGEERFNLIVRRIIYYYDGTIGKEASVRVICAI